MINFYKFYNQSGLDREEYKLGVGHITYIPMLIHMVLPEDVRGQRIRAVDLKPVLHILKKEVFQSYYYALYVLKGRFIEAEPYIMKSPYYAAMYARDIFKGRWVEAEFYIMKDVCSWDAYYRYF